MSDPTGRPLEERAREALRDQANVASRLDPAWAEQYHDAARLAEQEQPDPPAERLFSRKVLFGWAFAALVFVFIIRMVIPVVFETVRETVVEKMRESTSNTATRVIPPVPAIPPIPPTPAIPAVGAPDRPETPQRPEAKDRPEANAPKAIPSAKSGATTVQAPAKK